MADGFDECHKKGSSAVRPLAVWNERATQEAGLWESTVRFFECLHPGDPDVNHIDLSTSLLIVCCYSVELVFSLSMLSLTCDFLP